MHISAFDRKQMLYKAVLSLTVEQIVSKSKAPYKINECILNALAFLFFFLSHLQQTKNYERLDEILKQIIYQCRFLYSVILTEYVAIDPRVCGCPSVCPSVRPYMFTCTKYDYFHVQRVKLSQSRHFIFEFTLLPVLTVFRPPFCPKVDDVER